MLPLLLRRLGLGLVTLWAVSVLVFASTEILPGDVATAILGQSATPENVAQLHSDDNNLNAESAVTVEGDYAPDGFVIPKGSEMDGSDFTRRGPFFCFGVP